MSHTLAQTEQNGQFSITFTIPVADIEAGYKKTVAKLAQEVEIDGFRKGKAPLEKVEARLDKGAIYEDMIKDMLPKLYAQALDEYKLNPIVSPQVRLIKAEPDQDWQVEATAAQLPPVTLGDYEKKLKGLLATSSIWTPEQGKEDGDEKKKELTEEEKLTKVFDFLLKEISVEVPPMLIAQETDHYLSGLLDQVQKLGLTIDQYLASTNKTAESLRADYATRAINELKVEFVLAEISRNKQIKVEEKEIDDLIKSAPDEKMRKDLDTPEARARLTSSVLKRKVVESLLKMAA